MANPCPQTFLTSEFERFAKANAISDETLKKCGKEVAEGLIDARLGSGLIKKRLPRKGSGKSGGFRSILVFANDSRIIYIHGFAKNEKANLTATELSALRSLAAHLTTLSDEEMESAVVEGVLRLLK